MIEVKHMNKTVWAFFIFIFFGGGSKIVYIKKTSFTNMTLVNKISYLIKTALNQQTDRVSSVGGSIKLHLDCILYVINDHVGYRIHSHCRV